MDIPKKLKIINDLIDDVKVDIIKKVKEIPENWDAIELYWYVAEKFKEKMLSPTGNFKKSYKEYRNTVITKGL
ncbi:MAG: hypothetical protein V3V81_08245 [Candidatus Bathyarchaeia archaeon]